MRVADDPAHPPCAAVALPYGGEPGHLAWSFRLALVRKVEAVLAREQRKAAREQVEADRISNGLAPKPRLFRIGAGAPHHRRRDLRATGVQARLVVVELGILIEERRHRLLVTSVVRFPERRVCAPDLGFRAAGLGLRRRGCGDAGWRCR